MYSLSIELQRMLLNVICWAFEKTQCAYIACNGSKLSKCGPYTVTSDSCSLVRFSGWLMAVMPNWTGLADGGRKARRMALLATFMKATMACQPLLLYHTWQKGHVTALGW